MAYIYCADIYCDDCGKAIMKELKKQGLVPEHPEDRSTYDSDEYPKYADDEEETDSPQHCGNHADCLNAIELGDGDKIGKLIGTTLTNDGVQYVKEAIEEAIANSEDETSSVALSIWKTEFADYL